MRLKAQSLELWLIYFPLTPRNHYTNAYRPTILGLTALLLILHVERDLHCPFPLLGQLELCGPYDLKPKVIPGPTGSQSLTTMDLITNKKVQSFLKAEDGKESKHTLSQQK